MAEIMNKIWVTYDEQYDPAQSMTYNIESALKELPLDPYNKIYSVQVIVMEVEE